MVNRARKIVHHHLQFPMPVGHIRIGVSEKGLASLKVVGREVTPEASYPEIIADNMLQGIVTLTTTWLQSYFEAKNVKVSEIPLDLFGTDFEVKVWHALLRIPQGELVSYGELARCIGHRTAARAVGNCVGRNPIWFIIPCHRVIAANQCLGGFAGGLSLKQWLLEHEGHIVSGNKIVDKSVP